MSTHFRINKKKKGKKEKNKYQGKWRDWQHKYNNLNYTQLYSRRMNHIHSTNIVYKKQITQLKKSKQKKVWRESSSLLWLWLMVFSVRICMHECVRVRVFAWTKCSIIPHTCVYMWVLNICLNLHFPTAEINMNKFSLRRVKNSCCKNISAAVPHGSVIYPIDWRIC